MNQHELGKKVIELRKLKVLTQEELAEKCKLSVRTLQRVESGEVFPRNYTIRTILAALDYDINESAILINKELESNQQILYSWLKHSYRYMVDLFNLKTNTMKKITILSITISFLAFGLLFLNIETKGQNNNKLNESMQLDKINSDSINGKMNLNINCQDMWTEKDEIFGSDVRFNYEGVKCMFKLLRINTLTHEFRSVLLRGVILPNKIEITLPKKTLDAHIITFISLQKEIKGEKIHLWGNAKLTSSDCTIETNEIIITTE